MAHPVAPLAVSSGARRTRVSGRHARRDIPAAVLAVLAVIYLLQWAQEVFVPLVLGVLLSYALDTGAMYPFCSTPSATGASPSRRRRKRPRTGEVDLVA
jgi:hypothetical protein